MLLAEARTLANRCGCAQEFADYLAQLREAHKAKRALRDELDHAQML